MCLLKIKLKKVKVKFHYKLYKNPVGRPHKSRSPSKIAKPRASIAIAITTVPIDVEIEQPSVVTVAVISADIGNIVRIEVGIVAGCINLGIIKIPKLMCTC